MRARWILVAVLALAAETTLGAWLVIDSEHDDSKWLTLGFAIPVGLSFVIAGIVARVRRPDNRIGLYLAATGYLWFFGALSNANSDVLFTLGAVFGNLAFVPFALLIFSFPTGRLETRWQRRYVTALAILLQLVPLLYFLFQPSPERDCVGGCRSSAIAVTDAPRVAAAIDWFGLTSGIALIAAAVALLAARWHRATPVTRRALRLVLSTSFAALLALLAVNLVEAVSTSASQALSPIVLLALTAVPVAFLVGVLRSHLARASVARLVAQLAGGTPLRHALSEALGDPELEIGFWTSEHDRFVDVAGRPFDPTRFGHGRASTIVEGGGERIAVLVHDATLSDEPELIGAVTGAATLAFQAARLEAELRAQVAIQLTIIETLPSVLLHIDTEGRIVNQNPAAVAVCGFDDEDELRGQYFWDVVIDAADRADVIERFRAAAPRFPAAAHENAFTNRRGERMVIAWQTAPVVESGVVTSIVAAGLDVTGRLAQEAALQRERDITATLMSAIPSFVVVVDDEATIVDSGIDETRAGVNDAFRSGLGWEDAEIVRTSVLDLIAPEDAFGARMAIASAANGVASQERESRWRRADGSELIVAWTATPVADVTGRRTSLVLVSGIDVTERKRQEAEVRASRARIIEAADAARRALERNLHDGAQQRLVSLSLALRLAEAKLATAPSETATIIATAREELAQALAELRELARGIHPAILSDRGLQPALEALADRSPVPVELATSDERLPEQIEAAAYYVVAEALTNVAKYANATIARVTVTRENGLVAVEVVDDGVGGAAPGGGSGLSGLSDRVAALDGRLQVISPTSGGTTVRAEIPYG